MDRFEQFIVPDTLANEKGYANVFGDNGGMTYMGVTTVFYPGWAGWALIKAWIAKHGEPNRGYVFTESDIPGLRGMVINFYRSEFYNHLGGDRLENIDAAKDLFDTCVLNGLPTGIRLSCRALEIDERTHADEEFINKFNEVNTI